MLGNSVASAGVGAGVEVNLNQNIPRSVESVLSTEALTKTKVLKALQCGKCNCIAQRCMPARQFSPGKCVLLQCRNKGRGSNCQTWYLCLVCEKPVSQKRAKHHFKCPSHLSAYNKQKNAYQQQEEQLEEAQLDDSNSSESNPFRMEVVKIENDSIQSQSIESETVISGITTAEASKRKENACAMDWLEAAFVHIPKASIMELIESFDDQLNMRLYFAAEHGRVGGGVQYLVTRMFRKNEHIGGQIGVQIATFEEARWHFLSFVQYISMGERQRKRQALLTSTTASSLVRNNFFQATRPILHHEQDRFYGRSNKDTLWNAVPIPTTRNIDGIGYISPVNACRFLLAFATELDDFTVEFSQHPAGNDDPSSVEPKDIVVFHISQSRAMQDWKHAVQGSSDEQCAAKMKRFALAWMTDWRDGFGANRTKQNRKSTNAWTISLSTPKDRINAIDNTLPIALGLKKNPAWPKVEQLFREDMQKLSNGDRPMMLYHGGFKKIIPVCIRRIACLTDKVERGDYTATLSCTSNYHRKFGSIVRIDAPKFKLQPLRECLDGQRKGTSDNQLRQYGWSHAFVDNSLNGGLFPACYSCRRANANLLRDVAAFDASTPNIPCQQCADWVLDDTTKHMLRFRAPKSYPVEQLPNCPVAPPVGREVGREYLEWMVLDFKSLRQAVRYAFYNCCAKTRTGWTKQICRSYLRSCGVNGKQQDELYEAARQAFKDNAVIDYDDNCTKLGGYEMPAAWIGDLSVPYFIELLMHLLFLGCAKSNFKLTNKFLSTVNRGEQTFKKSVQELLKALTGFNLAWCLVLPFNGSKKSKLTTGTWVSENWLAWVRIQKVVFVWFARNIEDERKGANDVIRMVACFTALVARVCSHSGVNKKLLGLIDCLVKEFLSSVRELDIRVRHKEMNALANSSSADDDGQEVTGTSDGNSPGADKSREQFWLKSNYMSLTNLVNAMLLLGPLVNFWDGGGKGERYIQEIKPHIPRGVRDGGLFFLRLLEKLFKLKAMAFIEEFLTPKQPKEEEISSDNSSSNDSNASEANGTTISAASSEVIIEATIPTTICLGNDGSSLSTDDSGEDQNEEEQWSSPMEDEQMSKARTIYVYKNKSVLQEAFGNQEPISFVILRGKSGDAEAYALYKRPRSRNRFGWCKVEFDDENGVKVCGLWYCPLKLKNVTAQPPKKFDKIQQVARMSTLAIPLRYMLGRNHANAAKYCVITNWWRERNENGRYVLPNLDFDRYKERPLRTDAE